MKFLSQILKVLLGSEDVFISSEAGGSRLLGNVTKLHGVTSQQIVIMHNFDRKS
jgi:hypothetical protein